MACLGKRKTGDKRRSPVPPKLALSLRQNSIFGGACEIIAGDGLPLSTLHEVPPEACLRSAHGAICTCAVIIHNCNREPVDAPPLHPTCVGASPPKGRGPNGRRSFSGNGVYQDLSGCLVGRAVSRQEFGVGRIRSSLRRRFCDHLAASPGVKTPALTVGRVGDLARFHAGFPATVVGHA